MQLGYERGASLAYNLDDDAKSTHERRLPSAAFGWRDREIRGGLCWTLCNDARSATQRYGRRVPRLCHVCERIACELMFVRLLRSDSLPCPVF